MGTLVKSMANFAFKIQVEPNSKSIINLLTTFKNSTVRCGKEHSILNENYATSSTSVFGASKK